MLMMPRWLQACVGSERLPAYPLLCSLCIILSSAAGAAHRNRFKITNAEVFWVRLQILASKRLSLARHSLKGPELMPAVCLECLCAGCRGQGAHS